MALLQKAGTAVKDVLDNVEDEILADVKIIKPKVDSIVNSVNNIEKTALVVGIILCLIALIALLIYIFRKPKIEV